VLNGEALMSQGREDKEKLITQLKEFLANLTNAKLVEQQANTAENMMRQLKYVPMPAGKAIVIG
jgi:transcriptional regulator of heat shock response